MSETGKPDTLNEIGVLKRREIEARILAPLLQALGQRFGREEVLAVMREVIIRVAKEQGRQLAQTMGDNELAQLAASLEAWQKDDALRLELLALDEHEFSFNVTRCRYAELYRALGLEELGATLSCNRDAALIEGFNPNIQLTRTQTIMQGALFCDFRYRLKQETANQPATVLQSASPNQEGIQ
jgi:predicted ArsR family transcriptional regulator